MINKEYKRREIEIKFLLSVIKEYEENGAGGISSERCRKLDRLESKYL